MEKSIKVLIQQLEDAKDLPLPQYMSSGAAGMDLYANISEPLKIYPGDIKLVPTGICIALPEGYEAQIRPRSGLAFNHGIGVVNSPGTIDSDYRGEIKIIMINWGNSKFVINRGDRIAQMVINKIEQIQWNVVESLEETVRGDGGFGHTGVDK